MARLRIVTLGVVSLLLAACGPGGATTAPSGPASAAPTQASLPPSVTAEPTQDACATESLATKTAGTLTVGTDNPAFPPYFQARDGGNTEPWDPAWGDPTTGKGFESAVAYAIAEQLGFASDAVTWIPIALQPIVRAGREGLRHVHQPGHVQRGARRERGPVRRLLLRQPDRGGHEGQRVRGRNHDHGAQGRRARRPGRHDELRDDRGRHPDRPRRPASSTRPRTRSRP